MPSIRILLVDDSPEFLESAADFMSEDPQILVVGRALGCDDALKQVDLLRPDLVLMDLVMPGMGGLAATRFIKARLSAPRVVVLTLYDDDEYRAAAREAGADGFVGKSEFGAQLLPLIHDLFGDHSLGALGQMTE